MRRCIELGWTFFWISSVTPGGGMAMLPLMEREFVERRQWLTTDEILDIIAVVQSLPGIIAINMATIIGYRIRGVPGAVIAAAASAITPFAVVAALAGCMTALSDSPTLCHIFLGIRAGTAALIMLSLAKLAKSALDGWLAWMLAVLGFVAAVVFNIDVAYVILAGFAVGVWLMVIGAARRAR